jgi:hypothetical protein
MDPVTITAEALAALNGILNIIAAIRASGGQTDAQILAAGQAMDNANDQLYATLKAALATPPPAA